MLAYRIGNIILGHTADHPDPKFRPNHYLTLNDQPVEMIRNVGARDRAILRDYEPKPGVAKCLHSRVMLSSRQIAESLQAA